MRSAAFVDYGTDSYHLSEFSGRMVGYAEVMAEKSDDGLTAGWPCFKLALMLGFAPAGRPRAVATWDATAILRWRPGPIVLSVSPGLMRRKC
jgi:hypothetical protein